MQLAIVAALFAFGLGGFGLALFTLHRREKARRRPHAYDRSMWSGT